MIKVAYQVNNLSDARNFAAHLFDWIFFKVDQEGVIDLALFNSLSGWVEGSRLGLHVPAGSDLNVIATRFTGADAFWVDELPGTGTGGRLIFSHKVETRPDYLVQTQPGGLPADKFLLDLSRLPFEERSAIDLSRVAGIALGGGDELRPGVKDYDGINDWLDWLEEQS